jgi:hypothetical protein
MIFKLYDCVVGIKADGQDYEFPHVNEVTYEDPEENKLTRGANASNKTGIVYKDGMKDPKTAACTILDMPLEIKTVLDTKFADQTRIDFYAVAANGSSVWLKNGVVSKLPIQKTISDTVESMGLDLAFASFDFKTNFKE